MEPRDDDPNVVVVSDPEPTDEPVRQSRTSSADILRAIQELPEKVAARVDGKGDPKAKGSVAEVTFAPEPTPEPEDGPPDDEQDDGPPAPTPTAPDKPRFGFPRGRRHRVEIGT